MLKEIEQSANVQDNPEEMNAHTEQVPRGKTKAKVAFFTKECFVATVYK